jgi:large subunit ribosomal protein L2
VGIKRYKPITPGLREKTSLTFEEITDTKPLKALTKGRKSLNGRMNTGRISIWRRGSGHKKKYRIIDFLRDKFDIEAKVISIQYDPNRSANIALLNYVDGEKRYIIAPLNLFVGAKIISGEKAKISIGNAMKLKNIPVGTIVHNVEIEPRKGAQLARSAGTFVQLSGFEKDKAILKMPSGEMRYINSDCFATIGQVGNLDKNKISIGKAGRKRWMGIRPTVRGVAMNPIDHPHGGGEGKTSGGRHPVTPWGISTKGHKTRKQRKFTSSFIIRRRNAKS